MQCVRNKGRSRERKKERENKREKQRMRERKRKRSTEGKKINSLQNRLSIDVTKYEERKKREKKK